LAHFKDAPADAEETFREAPVEDLLSKDDSQQQLKPREAGALQPGKVWMQV
jgi:hypothetical protein